MKVRALKKRAIPRMLFATRMRAYDRTLQECRDRCIAALEGLQAEFLSWEASHERQGNQA